MEYTKGCRGPYYCISIENALLGIIFLEHKYPGDLKEHLSDAFALMNQTYSTSYLPFGQT